MTTTTETPKETWDRLYAERARLLNLGLRSPDQNARIRDLAHQLRALREEPPHGYTLPAAAAALIDHARAHGWLAGAQWYGLPGLDEEGDAPRLTVEVGRQATTEEADRGSRWLYQLTWHSHGCPHGRLRRFGRGGASTPSEPWHHDAPSVRAIREVIAANPGPAA